MNCATTFHDRVMFVIINQTEYGMMVTNKRSYDSYGTYILYMGYGAVNVVYYSFRWPPRVVLFINGYRCAQEILVNFCYLPTPLLMGGGGSPIFPLVVHMLSSDHTSFWLAAYCIKIPWITVKSVSITCTIVSQYFSMISQFGAHIILSNLFF